MEIWKDIYFWQDGVEYDYRGLYAVSNFGNVKSLGNDKTRKEKILKPREDKSGYEYVILYKDGKQKFFTIHRLVAFMFIKGYFDGAEVNHRDENKENNHVENLEWCTREYNNNYGTRNERASETMKGKSGMYDRTGEKHPRARKVVSVDPLTKQIVFIWQYVKQATDFYGIDRKTLDYYLKGKAKSGHLYNGFLWYYADEELITY